MCAPSHNGIYWHLSSHTRASLSCITNMDMAQSCILALHEEKKGMKNAEYLTMEVFLLGKPRMTKGSIVVKDKVLSLPYQYDPG